VRKWLQLVQMPFGLTFAGYVGDFSEPPTPESHRGKVERLRDAPAEWVQQFEALGLNPNQAQV
jgi:hypothetical protein